MSRLSIQGPFTGKAGFYPERESGMGKFPVGVTCRLAGLQTKEIALLDTAAQWSLVGSEMAELVAPNLGTPLQEINYHTRFGLLQCELHRLDMTLVAEQGEDLTVHATVAVCAGFPKSMIVLGYTGFLERICFALDPGSSSDAIPTILFGSCG